MKINEDNLYVYNIHVVRIPEERRHWASLKEYLKK